MVESKTKGSLSNRVECRTCTQHISNSRSRSCAALRDTERAFNIEYSYWVNSKMQSMNNSHFVDPFVTGLLRRPVFPGLANFRYDLISEAVSTLQSHHWRFSQ